MTRPIYVRFSDDGKHIAKWSHEPFEPSVSYVPGPAQLDQAREEERERAAKILEQAIEEGYDVPARKVDQCEHGKFGWEDCVACYEVALTSIAAAIRTPDRTDGGAA